MITVNEIRIYSLIHDRKNKIENKSLTRSLFQNYNRCFSLILKDVPFFLNRPIFFHFIENYSTSLIVLGEEKKIRVEKRINDMQSEIIDSNLITQNNLERFLYQSTSSKIIKK